MILMFTTNWSLSWWCCAHCNYNNPSQLFWSIKSYKLTIGTCVLCVVFHVINDPLPSRWIIIIIISILAISMVVLLYIINKDIVIAICDFLLNFGAFEIHYDVVIHCHCPMWFFLYFGPFENCCHVVIIHFHFTFVLLVLVLQAIVHCHTLKKLCS